MIKQIQFVKRNNSKPLTVVHNPKWVAILFLFSLIVFSSNSFGQSLNSISGKVIDEKGLEVPGANVFILGTTKGTITNFNGAFTLGNVKGTDTLQISFLGYKTITKPINNEEFIAISLEPDMVGIGEVVVVGYGEMRKADLTGSVSALSSDELVKTAVPNVTSTLAGKVTGVITRQTSGRPGADNPTFLIRGKSTFDPDNKGTNDPLVLVDGFERDFNRIDPNDIASITVLKDAASTAIYGSRGANGVILVTTKRGIKATPEIVFSTSYTSQKPTFVPEYMNAGEYAQYMNEASLNSGSNPEYTDEQVQQYKDGTLPGTNWWDEVMRSNAPIKQQNLSVNGKADNAAYFLSFGHLDQQGLYATSKYKRYNVRSNIDVNLSDNLTAVVNISLRKDNTNASIISDYKIHQSLQTGIPTTLAYIPEELREEYDELGLNANGTGASPIGEALYSGYRATENNIAETSMGLKYKVSYIKGLSVKLDYSYDYHKRMGKSFKEPYWVSFITPKNTIPGTKESESLVSLEQNEEFWNKQTLQAGLNYNTNIGKHNIASTLVYEQIESKYNMMMAYREDFLGTTIEELFAGSDENKDNDGRASESARQSYVGRLVYNYNDKYLAQVNGRYDGSSNFGPGHRWGFFPAFSAGWRLSEEAFMNNVSFLDDFKFRVSWGKSGNDNTDPFQYLSTYSITNGYMTGIPAVYNTGINDNGIPNESITWETAISSNYGFEFSIMDGLLSGEFDYFTKRTEDILIARNASVPLTFGSTLPAENLGIVDNHGIELILRHRNRINDFSYELEGNITYATSEVIFIDEPLEVSDRLKETGRPFDGRYGYTAIGIFQTQEEIDNAPDQDLNGNQSIHPGDIRYKDLNDDGVIDGEDRHFIGKGSTPELIFGLNSNLRYKDFGLNFAFQGASNFTRYNYLSSFEKDYNTYKVLSDSWREGNEDAKYPRLESDGRSENNSRYSTFWMEDGFYIKLRNIEFSYTLRNKSYLDKVGIKQIAFSASGRNLLTIAKKDGFDPEGTNNEYPIMSSVSLGLSVVF